MKREQTPSFVWGEAINARGDKKTARIRTPNGYTLTIMGSLAVVEHLMMNRIAGGAYTCGNVNGRKSDNPVTRGWPAEDCIIAQGGTGDAPALCAYSRVRITLPI